MKALEGGNNVKVYNLSAGKSLPDWLTDRKKRKLAKRGADSQHNLELIQDFDMPDVSGRIKLSPDGQYILASGTYKPKLKCFEVSALSQKFERCFDADVIEFEVLSDDYSKIVLLQEERYLEFHNQGGRWYRTRVPTFGRDLAYHFPSCDLYIASASSDVYRLNLTQGRFLESIKVDSKSVNKVIFNPNHYLLACGTDDGKVEAWDPRSRSRVGTLDCAVAVAMSDVPLISKETHKYLGVSSLAFDGTLAMAVGMKTGQTLLYDIRSSKPLLVKDHLDGLAVKDVEFHPSSGMVLSMSANAVKIWERVSGKTHASIESDVIYNDLCVVPHSGMFFIATEHPKMQTYFLPSLGPAPKWCGYLDALIEELEEEGVPQTYDDYKFVTEKELQTLGLDDLIGTNVLRAVMHGYYIDARLYNKAKMIANPFDYQEFVKKKVQEKITQQNQKKVIEKEAPKVNQKLFGRLMQDMECGTDKQMNSAKHILKDGRFQTMFTEEEFDIDEESEAFKITQPTLQRNKKKMKQAAASELEDGFSKEEELVQSDPSSSDSDDIISSEDDGEENMNVSDKEDIPTRKGYIANRGRGKPKPKRKDVVIPEGPALSSSNIVSADSLAELKKSRKRLSKLCLSDRLEEDEDVNQDEGSWFGAKEISFIPRQKGKEQAKIDKIREQQKKHHSERKQMIRKSNTLRGRLRMNKAVT